MDWGREAVEGGSYLLVSDVMEVIDVRLECLTKIKIEIVKADDGNEGCDKRSFEMRQKAKEVEFFQGEGCSKVDWDDKAGEMKSVGVRLTGNAKIGNDFYSEGVV